ncbi:MAG TPA: asparagine synthase (glutamine-hydrolyzing) [Humidesulfovibrio sp.]|uniref:asparagine synthase (glutamine-hydrolyzing) n=1 Tax=Humidesulfovibrio sp. TaxID=2910988 RepID=UPI002D1317A8|nr:asparagine synthase (glutamine-hydrolyzing) [Humidesulfovibrio sp.]HWR02662.1 asparagine synthase (glutamine-hydrolyzing) [Humidesulfovibrio sp.]
MCGIAGEFNPKGQTADASVMSRMTDAMRHRGPDGAGVWRSPSGRCLLGHRRLSIIDLSSAADQPMHNRAGTVHVAFNGEIYNHAQIRAELESLGVRDWQTDHSDTEVLLKAYEHWGLEAIQRFYGMFAFAIHDERDPARPVLHLVRDRIGIKPLYIAQRGHSWLFASEIRALMQHPLLSPEMDLTAFWHYLTFIITPAPLTMFRGVFKIPAGWLVTIDHEGRAKASQYWDCKPSAADTWRESDLSFDDAVAEFTRLMRLSIERRMVSDVPFGVLLSGGVDSSLIVALMSEIMDRPVTTFSIGYEGLDDLNEFQHASRIAEQYRTDHHTTLISAKEAQDFLPLLVRLQDEPIADNVCIPLYFLARLVREQGTTVVQVGEGADENFLGYWWCEHYRQKYEQVWQGGTATPWWKRLFGSPQTRTASAEDTAILGRRAAGQELFWGGAVCWWGDLRTKLTPDLAPFRQQVSCPVEGLLPSALTTLESADVARHYLGGLTGNLAEPEVLQKIPYMELKLRLPEHLLMRVDKLTMAHAIEARVPFLDHDLVDFARRLPPSYKLKDGVGKRIVKKAAEPYLPHDIIYRKKQGFGAPVDRWLKEPRFAARAKAVTERSRLVREGFLDKAYLGTLLEQETTVGTGHSFHLWTVLNALIWHESWIEGREDCF